MSKFIVDIFDAHSLDLELIGKKAHELAQLKHLSVPIPNGFIITTAFFQEFLTQTGISKKINEADNMYHPSLKDSKDKLYEPIRKKIMHTQIPYNLSSELHKFYKKFAGDFNETSINIFTSSNTNKITHFSDIKGDANMILKIKSIWTSYLDKPVAIIVMQNIKAEIKGKVFTDIPTFDKNLTPKQITELINYCKIIQNHFYFPKEIEYLVAKNKFYITRISLFTGAVKYSVKQSPQNKKLIKGISINTGIATGPVKIFYKNHINARIKKGEIIIASEIKPSLYNKIKNAKAVVIDSIFTNSQVKFFYRKNFKVPTIIGTKNASIVFHNGNVVTVNGVSGEIYSGGII